MDPKQRVSTALAREGVSHYDIGPELAAAILATEGFELPEGCPISASSNVVINRAQLEAIADALS